MKLFSSLKNSAQSYLGQYQQQDPATYAAAQQAVGGLLILDGFIGIDNPLGGKKRPGIFGTLIGVAVGIVCMFVPVMFNTISGMDKMAATTNATVVTVGAPVVSQSSSTSSSSSSSSSSCTLTAKYTVNGTEYTKTSGDSSSANCSLAVGSSVAINYDPNNPNAWSANAKTLGLFLSVFFWVGLVSVITSIVTFAIRLASIIFGWKILKSGRALAKTLPQGTNLGTVIDEIKQHFRSTVFGSGGSMPLVPTQPIAAATAPVATPPVAEQQFPAATPFASPTAPYAQPAPMAAPITREQPAPPTPPTPPSTPQF